MHNKRLFAGTVAALLLCASGAFAGYQITQTVVISGTTAYGVLNDVRHSANTVEFIGCKIAWLPGSATVNCFVKNAAGTYKTCSATDPALVAAAAHADRFSWLQFGWNTAGTCTSIETWQGSHYID